MAVYLCCAGRLRYVPQAPFRLFRDATGGCVSLRSTARPSAAPRHFTPPEAQARRLLRACMLRIAPLHQQAQKHHSHRPFKVVSSVLSRVDVSVYQVKAEKSFE